MRNNTEMRSNVARLAAIVGGIAVIVSCDSSPYRGVFGGGLSGGPTGTAPVGPPSGADTFPPNVTITNPLAGQQLNIGDSILVEVTLVDDRKLGPVTISGLKEDGDTALGTFVRTVRYTPVSAPPATQPYQPGQTAAQFRRYIHPAAPLDTTVDSLVIQAVLADSAGNLDTARTVVQLVTGPKVSITNPASGTDVTRGFNMTVTAAAQHPGGVASLTITVQGEATWPTPLNPPPITQIFGGQQQVTLTGSVFIPADAPVDGRITINASAVDVNGNPGSAAPTIVSVRDAGSVAPLVCFAVVNAGQTVCDHVPTKLEFSDSVTIKADGDGIRAIGFIIKDSDGNVIRRDSVEYTAAPFASNAVETMPLGLGRTTQGESINITAFAWDNNTPQRIGFSVEPGTVVPITIEAAGFADSVLITYGQTFTIPRLGGVVSDLAVDENNGNVFLSNTNYNLLEIWSNTGKDFDPDGIQVGALPWGLVVQTDGDTLLVGNSGSTTISKVCINPTVCAGGVMAEALSERLRTTNTVIYQVVFGRDNAGIIRLIRGPDVSYSDRPQYVAQSAGGRVFFSTRPTTAATPGTLRWVDPTLAVPDTRQIWQYGDLSLANTSYAIFNADSIAVVVSSPSSLQPDQLVIWDHEYGGTTLITVSDSLPLDAGTANNALGGDVEVVPGLDVASLALTDTTFVAASSDRNWIGYGEGNTAGVGRVMMVQDPVGPLPVFFSPRMFVTDIVHNAAEKVFGLAIDPTGLQVTAHGFQTYVAALDVPFHLRLDGVYDSFDNGAGVAYHPNAAGTNTPDPDERVLFTATSSGVIEVVDVAHYNNRGTFITKNTLYGPLRASLPLPGDAADIILKLYGLTAGGLVVIDLRAEDIQ